MLSSRTIDRSIFFLSKCVPYWNAGNGSYLYLLSHMVGILKCYRLALTTCLIKMRCLFALGMPKLMGAS